MTRKGKQPGGHNPLTYHERAKLTAYGTTTVHLDTASQRRFGDCCLGLEPAKDPVATPSGHIYSREAIVSYLLTKTQEYKQARAAHEAEVAARARSDKMAAQESAAQSLDAFAQGERGAAMRGLHDHARAREMDVSQRVSTETKAAGQEILQRTSYWLADFQPTHDNGESAAGAAPERPPSPMSGRPGLRLKDLTPLVLHRETTRTAGGATKKKKKKTKDDDDDDDENDKDETVARKRKTGNDDDDDETGQCQCAVSHKAITTQKAVAIRRTGQVMLWDIFESLARPSMTCPVTGQKFKEKDILLLQQAASGFAASGIVESKRYRPTLT